MIPPSVIGDDIIILGVVLAIFLLALSKPWKTDHANHFVALVFISPVLCSLCTVAVASGTIIIVLAKRRKNEKPTVVNMENPSYQGEVMTDLSSAFLYV